MINKHQYPDALIKAIREPEKTPKLFHIEKGSSKYLYIFIFEEDGKKIYDIVTYGNFSIKDYLLQFYLKSQDEISYPEERDFDKLILFIKEIFIDDKLDSVFIDGEKITLDETLYMAIKYCDDRLSEEIHEALFNFIEEKLKQISEKLIKK